MNLRVKGRVAAIFMGLLALIHSSAAVAFVDQTHLIVSPAGASVVYIAKYGHAYLWSSGSSEVIEGKWRTIPEDSAVTEKFCLRFGRENFNPLTGKSGRGAECVPFGLTFDVMVEFVFNDVFGLTTCKTVPFALTGKRTSLAKLASKAGVKLLTPVIVTEDLISRPGEKMTAKEMAFNQDLMDHPEKYAPRSPSEIVPPPCAD